MSRSGLMRIRISTGSPSGGIDAFMASATATGGTSSDGEICIGDGGSEAEVLLILSADLCTSFEMHAPPPFSRMELKAVAM